MAIFEGAAAAGSFTLPFAAKNEQDKKKASEAGQQESSIRGHNQAAGSVT